MKGSQALNEDDDHPLAHALDHDSSTLLASDADAQLIVTLALQVQATLRSGCCSHKAGFTFVRSCACRCFVWRNSSADCFACGTSGDHSAQRRPRAQNAQAVQQPRNARLFRRREWRTDADVRSARRQEERAALRCVSLRFCLVRVFAVRSRRIALSTMLLALELIDFTVGLTALRTTRSCSHARAPAALGTRSGQWR